MEKKIKRVVESNGSPLDTDLWIDSSGDAPVLKTKQHGEWVEIGGGTSPSPEPEPTPSGPMAYFPYYGKVVGMVDNTNHGAWSFDYASGTAKLSKPIIPIEDLEDYMLDNRDEWGWCSFSFNPVLEYDSTLYGNRNSILIEVNGGPNHITGEFEYDITSRGPGWPAKTIENGVDYVIYLDIED